MQATATVTPRFAEVLLLPLVHEARDHLAVRLGARAERLAFAVEADARLAVDAHRPGLLQAVQNLVQNAVEAYPEDAPRLEIRVTAGLLRAGSQLEITVADRGAGMTEAQRENLFIPFGSRKPGGTGLGLVISRAMIEELHGGTLSLESVRGVGTTVKIVLPTHQTGTVKRG